jgi:hypothetical protein
MAHVVGMFIERIREVFSFVANDKLVNLIREPRG